MSRGTPTFSRSLTCARTPVLRRRAHAISSWASGSRTSSCSASRTTPTGTASSPHPVIAERTLMTLISPSTGMSCRSLFCPHECPNLYDRVGQEFNELYEKYERENRQRKVIFCRHPVHPLPVSGTPTSTFPFFFFRRLSPPDDQGADALVRHPGRPDRDGHALHDVQGYVFCCWCGG